MSDELAFADARRQSRASLLGTWLDGGSIEIYTSPRPATADTAVTTQTLLLVASLPDPSGEATDGVWVGDLPEPAMVLADGTAAWARIYDDVDGVVCDLDIGLTGSGAALELSNLGLVSGANVTPTSLTITEG